MFRSPEPRYYKLIGKLAVPVRDARAWGKWFETGNRRVALNQLGPLMVSTVFLGLDHNWFGSGDPLLFETMIFGDNEDGYQVRTSTWAQAERAHQEAIEVARRTLATARPLLAAWAEQEETDAEPET